MRIPPLRIGFSEIGMDTYWLKLAHLKSRLEGCLATVDPKLAHSGVENINPALIDTPEKAEGPAMLFVERMVT